MNHHVVHALFVLFTIALTVICVWGGELQHRTDERFQNKALPRIALATLMRSPTELPHWLQHYRDLGVVGFFVRLEDSPNWECFLRDQPDVLHLEVGESATGTSNYHSLMDRQRDFVNKVIEMASVHDVDFVLHLDQDELLEGSLSVFAELPPSAKTVHMENVEAVYTDSSDTACFSAKRFSRCSKGGACRSYANGKGGGRPDKGVAFAGPHYFWYNGQVHGSHLHEIPYDRLHVLHFDSCTLGSFVSKFYHVGQNVDLGNIPFSSYPNAIKAATTAHQVYKDIAME